MAINPRDRTSSTGTTATITTQGNALRWIVYVIGDIGLLLVLLSLLGVFDGATETVTTPALATTEGGATAPAIPAAPQ